MNQCLAWFSFSSTDEKTMAIYFGPDMDKSTLDLLLNWGPIIGCVCFPIQTWISGRSDGLRKAIWIGIALGFFGNVVRCIPIVVSESGIDGSFATTTAAYWMYHIGQIAIAASGPFFMGSVTKVACVWFGESERTTATAIATTANGVGTTVGFLNPQWLAPSASTVPNIFWFSLAISALPLVCALVYLPAGPPHPPSAAAADSLDTQPAQEEESQDDEQLGWFQKISLAGSNHSFVLLIIAAAVMSGVTAGWQGLLQSILGSVGVANTDASWIGFANGLAGNIAAVVSGWIMDRCLKCRLKLGIIFGLAGCALATAWFTLQLPCFIYDDAAPLPESQATLVVSLTLAGFFQGVTSPLFYELAAELIYPVKEEMSAGILVLLLNAAAAVLIFLNSVLTAGYMNFFMTATIAGVLVLVVVFVKEEYRRPQDNPHEPLLSGYSQEVEHKSMGPV